MRKSHASPINSLLAGALPAPTTNQQLKERINMTEDKAAKALRKVIVNLIPEEYSGTPIPNDVIVPIDISDKLEEGKHYCLESIQTEYETHGNTIGFVPYAEHEQFKKAVENILDATIVNTKQRDSIQKLLNNAFYNAQRFGNAVI